MYSPGVGQSSTIHSRYLVMNPSPSCTLHALQSLQGPYASPFTLQLASSQEEKWMHVVRKNSRLLFLFFFIHFFFGGGGWGRGSHAKVSRHFSVSDFELINRSISKEPASGARPIGVARSRFWVTCLKIVHCPAVPFVSGFCASFSPFIHFSEQFCISK